MMTFTMRLPLLFVACALAIPAVAELRIVFPDDECVIDVKRDFGAKGDGKTDDTAALQAALDAGSGNDVKQHKIVYMPNGTYRVRKSLVVNREKGRRGKANGKYATLWRLNHRTKFRAVRCPHRVSSWTSLPQRPTVLILERRR